MVDKLKGTVARMIDQRWSSARSWLFVAKVAWTLANVLVLIWYLRLNAQGRFEEQIFVFLVQNLLSFPSGFLSFLLFDYVDGSLLGRRIVHTLGGGWVAVLFESTFFFIVGYVQWFKLMPYLIAKLIAKLQVFAQRSSSGLSEDKK